jgi:hypothetical protein
MAKRKTKTIKKPKPKPKSLDLKLNKSAGTIEIFYEDQWLTVATFQDLVDIVEKKFAALVKTDKDNRFAAIAKTLFQTDETIQSKTVTTRQALEGIINRLRQLHEAHAALAELTTPGFKIIFDEVFAGDKDIDLITNPWFNPSIPFDSSGIITTQYPMMTYTSTYVTSGTNFINPLDSTFIYTISG